MSVYRPSIDRIDRKSYDSLGSTRLVIIFLSDSFPASFESTGEAFLFSDDTLK